MATSKHIKSTRQTPRDYSLQTAMAGPSNHIKIPRGLKPGPNSYALVAEGECLLPKYRPGDTIVCDPDQTPEPGDFVAVWWKDGIEQPSIKRLTLALPDRNWWHLTGDVSFLLTVDQLNPPKRMSAPLTKVEAVHKVIHCIPA